jgi:hypothetical protein
MIELALIVASATFAVGLAAAVALRALPSLRLQLAGLAVLSVVLPLTAVSLSGWVMFHMGADVKILAVAAASATAAAGAGLLLAASVSRRIARVSDASTRARRVGEPRPADAARVDERDAGGAGGRSR